MKPNFEELISNRVSKLEKMKSLLFCYLCSKRLAINYHAFCKYHNWGNPALLEKVLISTKDYIQNPNFNIDFASICDEFYTHIPDLEDFADDENAFYALYAAAAAHGTLEYVYSAENVDSFLHTPNLIIECLDMFIQIKEDLDSNEPHFEEKIESSPLMIKEKNMLISILLEIEKLNKIDSTIIEEIEGKIGVLELCSY